MSWELSGRLTPLLIGPVCLVSQRRFEEPVRRWSELPLTTDFQEITMENIQNDSKRLMTVVCAEESEFFVLDKEDYVNNSLDVMQQQELQVRLEFFT